MRERRPMVVRVRYNSWYISFYISLPSKLPNFALCGKREPQLEIFKISISNGWFAVSRHQK